MKEVLTSFRYTYVITQRILAKIDENFRYEVFRNEVSENVKYIAVISRASKLQIFKVRPGRDLNPDLPHESLNIRKLTHAGGPGSNPGLAEI